ncbi:MAG TPA: SRPBCC domain-containing protein [Burkholderiaceae bacterium]|nr:SRPBCC domain-containing protein [Burkholderiaceae bacterium]
MVDILHAIGIKSSPDRVYQALKERRHLAGWWTTDVRGAFDIGGVIQFHFGTTGRIDMKVIEQVPDRRVVWQVVDGPGEWIGSKVSFELKPDGDYTAVYFKHQGWKEPSELMHHCSTKWATFLMSLKSLVETGTGAPFPNDVHIGRTD